MAQSTEDLELFAPSMFADTDSYDTVDFRINQDVSFRLQCLSRDFQHTLKAEGKLVWPASETLCHYIQHLASKHQGIFSGKRVLEVGAGQGLAGMLMSKYAQSVTLTDYDEDALQLLQQNLKLNFDDNDSTRPSLDKLVWGNEASMTELEQKQGGLFDVIIGSDIVYYKAAVRPLFQTIDRLLKPSPEQKINNEQATEQQLEEAIKGGQGVFILCNQSGRLSVNYNDFYQAVDDFNFRLFEIELASFLQAEKLPREKTHLFLIFKR